MTLTAFSSAVPTRLHAYISTFLRRSYLDRRLTRSKISLCVSPHSQSLVIPLPANKGEQIGRQSDSAEHVDAMAMSMSMSSPRAAPSHDAYAQSEFKRRRVRKGTHSCWECKRRKMKCIFDPLTNATTTCNGCRRRGSQCVSQEFPEVVSFSMDNTLTTPSPIFGGERVARAETRYAGRDSTPSDGRTPTTPPSEDGRRADYVIPIPTPVSMTAEPLQHLAFYTSSEVRLPGSLVTMVTDTTFIRIPPSRMTFFKPLLIRQPNKVKTRGCLSSCMNLSPRAKIRRGYAQPAATLLSSPMKS